MTQMLPPIAHTPNPQQLAQPNGAKLWQAAKEFEALALGELLGPMFATADASKGRFGGGAAEQSWRPMLTQAMAKQMANAGGLGLAMPVFQQMLRMQEARDPTPIPTPVPILIPLPVPIQEKLP